MDQAAFLREVPLFEGLGAGELQEVAAAMVPRSFGAHEIIVSQGSSGLGFFLIKEGAADVVKDGAVVARLEAGGFFGETSLLADAPRTASVVACEPTECLVLLAWDFRELLAKRPDLSMKLLELVCRRTAGLPATAASAADAPGDDESPDVEGCLSRSELFASLSQKDLADLADKAEWRAYPPGHLIVSQGSSDPYFYVLAHGAVDVSRDGKSMARLGPGGFFGEISVLDGKPRTATVTAVEPSACAVLGSWDLRRLLATKPAIALRMLEVMSGRLKDTSARAAG
jgi:CRP-like cAMP-binding protein